MTRFTDKDLSALDLHIEATGSPAGFHPKPKKRRRNEESEMQRALIKWWDANAQKQFGVSPLLLFSVPNGANADARRGSIMKAEGQRKGVPDLVLARPVLCPIGPTMSQRIHALFLELKTPTGRLSPEQEVYHELLRAQGYRVEVARSLEEAKKIITEYLT